MLLGRRRALAAEQGIEQTGEVRAAEAAEQQQQRQNDEQNELLAIEATSRGDLDLNVAEVLSHCLIGHTASTCRSEEHTSELQSLMRISYAVFCLKKKKKKHTQ